jgi:hypothetical protein
LRFFWSASKLSALGFAPVRDSSILLVTDVASNIVDTWTHITLKSFAMFFS